MTYSTCTNILSYKYLIYGEHATQLVREVRPLLVTGAQCVESIVRCITRGRGEHWSIWPVGSHKFRDSSSIKNITFRLNSLNWFLNSLEFRLNCCFHHRGPSYYSRRDTILQIEIDREVYCRS